MAELNENGHEILDDRPIAMPVGFKRPETLAEQIRRMVRSERLAQEAEAMGKETWEEADDFDVGDDYDPSSPYEEVFEPDLPLPQILDKKKMPPKKAKKTDYEEERPVGQSKAPLRPSTAEKGDKLVFKDTDD